MFYAIYKITNLVDGKIYIGSHKTKNLNDNYMGSGKYLKRAQEKYGLENFKKEILFVFDNPEEMYSKEAEIVNEEFLTLENTYNLKVGGLGGWDLVNRTGLNISSENSRKGANSLNKHRTLKTELGIKLNETSAATFKKAHAEGKIRYDTFKGKHHSDEAKRKIGAANAVAQLGKRWVNNGIGAVCIRKDDLEEYLNKGFSLGRKIKN